MTEKEEEKSKGGMSIGLIIFIVAMVITVITLYVLYNKKSSHSTNDFMIHDAFSTMLGSLITAPINLLGAMAGGS